MPCVFPYVALLAIPYWLFPIGYALLAIPPGPPVLGGGGGGRQSGVGIRLEAGDLLVELNGVSGDSKEPHIYIAGHHRGIGRAI